MFANLYKFVVVAAFVANAARANPIPPSMDVIARGFISFDNYGGISSLSGFDNFYGEDNFSGLISSQTVVEQSEELVCHSVSIEIVQQRLLVLQEMAKRILTEQICEVETQVVTFEQFYASIGHFHDDLLRTSHLHVGFDTEIASHFSDILSSDGSLSTNDFGFSGQDLGQHTAVIGGSNWNDASSPSSVGAAYTAAVQASGGSLGLSSASVSPPVSSSPSDVSNPPTEDNDGGAASPATGGTGFAAPGATTGETSRRAWWQARDDRASWWQARENHSWWQARDEPSWWRRSPLKWW